MSSRKINFVEDVASVLGCDCAEIRRKYPYLETARCRDVLSASTLGELRCDGLGLTALKTREGHAPVVLQKFVIDEKNAHVPKIILILESPHKEEYRVRCCQCAKEHQCGLYSTPAPARGMTGIAIKMKLPLLFNRRFDDYYVGFMNLIQYQCSLGDDNDKRKDEIVWSLFTPDRFVYRTNFINRLRKVYNPEQDIIVVCHTGGKEKRDEIYHIIGERIEDVRCILSIGHPISWVRNPSKLSLSVKACTNMKKLPSEGFPVKNYSSLYAILSGERDSKMNRLSFRKYAKKALLENEK